MRSSDLREVGLGLIGAGVLGALTAVFSNVLAGFVVAIAIGIGLIALDTRRRRRTTTLVVPPEVRRAFDRAGNLIGSARSSHAQHLRRNSNDAEGDR